MGSATEKDIKAKLVEELGKIGYSADQLMEVTHTSPGFRPDYILRQNGYNIA